MRKELQAYLRLSNGCCTKCTGPCSRETRTEEELNEEAEKYKKYYDYLFSSCLIEGVDPYPINAINGGKHLRKKLLKGIYQLQDEGTKDFYYIINKDSDFAYAMCLLETFPKDINLHIYKHSYYKSKKKNYYEVLFSEQINEYLGGDIPLTPMSTIEMISNSFYYLPILQADSKNTKTFKVPLYRKKRILPITF